tara:strand:+ start:1214 stop:1480 length:267 start_codon:yes stop_codon:yes gene_type:complete
MKLNLNHVINQLTGNSKSSGKRYYKNSSYSKKSVNDYSKQNYRRLVELEKQVWNQQKLINNLLKTLKLNNVNDLIMDEKDAKKYQSQW